MLKLTTHYGFNELLHKYMYTWWKQHETNITQLFSKQQVTQNRYFPSFNLHVFVSIVTPPVSDMWSSNTKHSLIYSKYTYIMNFVYMYLQFWVELYPIHCSSENIEINWCIFNRFSLATVLCYALIRGTLYMNIWT